MILFNAWIKWINNNEMNGYRCGIATLSKTKSHIVIKRICQGCVTVSLANYWIKTKIETNNTVCKVIVTQSITWCWPICLFKLRIIFLQIPLYYPFTYIHSKGCRVGLVPTRVQNSSISSLWKARIPSIAALIALPSRPFV